MAMMAGVDSLSSPQDVSTSPEAGQVLHFSKKSPGMGQSPADLDKLKSEGGLSGPGLYGDMTGYSKLSGDMYGGTDYSRLLGGMPGVHGQADYSKLLAGGGQGLYHSFMQNSYMTSQLNMNHHQASLPNIPSSY